MERTEQYQRQAEQQFAAILQSAPPAIRIDQNGVWYYCDEPLEREYLVQLFYTVLTKQPDGYYLTTPVENVKITVDDVPYSVVSVSVDDNGDVRCTLNTGAVIPINEHHSPRLSNENVVYIPLESPKGVSVEARFTHSAYLQLAAHLIQHDAHTFTLESFGRIFVLEAP
jgi:hypothetical protein